MQNSNKWSSKYADCIYATTLLSKLEKLNQQVTQPVDMNEVRRGIYYAKKYHGSQMRLSGVPYYSHPIEVANMVAEYTGLEMPKYYRTDMIITSLLHDTIEDTELTENMISRVFSKQIARQVVDLTRVKTHGKISSSETLDLLFQQKKYDVALIKLFDRIHNLQTVGAKSPEKAMKIISETVRHFLILSTYLEVPQAEQQLIKLCYKSFLTKQPSADESKKNIQTILPTFQNEITRMQNQ
ncbi:HD domain-containing protein [Candidatus Tisiphia endosymbiont of Hybos culiciformis]|uniref:HD domain-containing protein n=1 Tax=Candidatus Tisiphia endosymbiont of Hybos culiciformis TaxID=3139331 RepID=UPI003CCB5AA5